MNKEDSLKKRYFSKLFTNLIGLIFNLIIAGMVPRGLGPKLYGDFDFLTNYFTRILSFMDLGTSTCFYIKLSQRQKDLNLVHFYLLFSCLISMILLVFVLFIDLSGFKSILLPGQIHIFIYFAALWAILTRFIEVLNKMSDAYGLTVYSENCKILQRFLSLIIILFLYYSEMLNLTNYFFFHFTIMIFLLLFFIILMEIKEYSFLSNWKITLVNIKNYSKEFYIYSNPLFFHALVGFIVGIFDRWILQYFSGSIQQGFFGLSYKISTICFLFSSAMTNLITREFAIAYAKGNIKEMARLFDRFVPLLYGISAYFSCFIALEASKVTTLIGGNEFQNAIIPVSIMAFYPIHQTYGQLSGSVFYATGNTALYRNIGVSILIIGLPFIYIMIAPVDKMGLDVGATGLAIKLVAIQFIGVNIQLWFNCRFLGLIFWRYFAHQIVCVIVLLVLAELAIIFIGELPGVNDNLIISFILEGFLYSILVLVVVYFKPKIFGLIRNDIQVIQNKIYSFLTL